MAARENQSLIDRHRRVIDDLIRSARSRGGIEIARGDNTRLILVLAGLEFEALDTAEMALAAFDAKRAHIADPLVRKTFECGVTAQWLQAHGDAALDAFNAVHDIHQTQASVQAKKAGVNMPDELLLSRVPPTAEIETLKRFEQVCKAAYGGERLYFIYRVLCGGCHATGDVLVSWLVPDDTPTGLRFSRPDGLPELIQMYALVASLVWVGSALEANLTIRSRTDSLNEAARMANVLPELNFSKRSTRRLRSRQSSPD